MFFVPKEAFKYSIPAIKSIFSIFSLIWITTSILALIAKTSLITEVTRLVRRELMLPDLELRPGTFKLCL